MKIEIERKALRIIPETVMDIAFMEDTLHLKKHGDSLKFTRLDKFNDNAIDFLEAGAKAVKKEELEKGNKHARN